MVGLRLFKLHTATSRIWWHCGQSVRLSVTLFCHNLRINLRIDLRNDLVCHNLNHHLCQHHCHLANQKEPQDLSYISDCMQLSKSF